VSPSRLMTEVPLPTPAEASRVAHDTKNSKGQESTVRIVSRPPRLTRPRPRQETEECRCHHMNYSSVRTDSTSWLRSILKSRCEQQRSELKRVNIELGGDFPTA
jgi:hypothetical protein